MPQLEEAANQFEQWVSPYTHWYNHNFDSALINFLGPSSTNEKLLWSTGFKYVKTYQEFCELASLLRKRDYEISNPPCSESEFYKAILQLHPKKVRSSEELIIPLEIRLTNAVSEFIQQFTRDNTISFSQFLTTGGFLWIKTYEEFLQFAVMLRDKGYVSPSPSFTSLDFAQSIQATFSGCKYWGNQKPITPSGVAIDIAAKKFCSWLNQNSANDDNRALVNYLSKGDGFEYIKTYEQFCQLAKLLQKDNNNILSPPCDPCEFAAEVKNINKDTHPNCWVGGAPLAPVISLEAKLQLAAEKFNFWMQHKGGAYTEDAHHKALIDFIKSKGDTYINSYDEFCQLAALLQSEKYHFNLAHLPGSKAEYMKLVFGDVIAMLNLSYSLSNNSIFTSKEDITATPQERRPPSPR